jgi:hypothetical protein
MFPSTLPTVRVQGTSSGLNSPYTSQQQPQLKKKKKGNWLRSGLEMLGFLTWLGLTGYAGYYIGYDPNLVNCPESTGAGPTAQMSVAQEIIESARMPPCPEVEEEEENGKVAGNTGRTFLLRIVLFLTPVIRLFISLLFLSDASSDFPPLYKDGGFSFSELKSLWSCSHAINDPSGSSSKTQSNADLFPGDSKDDQVDLSKTKWKSIISVEPKAFIEKYLSQYPGDMRALQPVTIFSHKPLEKFEEISDICKVLDIAIIPDKPGVCVAVTETFHDVASYHMLHADRKKE